MIVGFAIVTFFQLEYIEGTFHSDYNFMAILFHKEWWYLYIYNKKVEQHFLLSKPLHSFQNVVLSLFMVLDALPYQLKLWMYSDGFTIVLFLFSLNTRAFKFPHVIRVRGFRIYNNRILRINIIKNV